MEILTINPGNVPTRLSWQEELKSAFRDLGSLFKFLELKKSDFKNLDIPNDDFPILVTRPFAGRMQKGEPADPLLQQVILTHSAEPKQGKWSEDPVHDQEFEKAPGVLQKYKGRALLIITGACAIHCRYCFRQNFNYSAVVRQGIGEAIEWIRNDSTISEVILSGGDPLLITDQALARILEQLEAIGHVKRIRIHTRAPVVLPTRITPELLKRFSLCEKSIWVVLHINHAAEIDEMVVKMIEQLHSVRVTVLNQSVLLAQVNDRFEVQRDLCETLVNQGVLPYYLHLLDQVHGAQGYEVSQDRGAQIIAKLRAELPGYAVPRLVKEVPGEASKTLLR